MNAVEVIEQIKRLPEQERSKVVEYIQRDLSTKDCHVDDKAAKVAADEVFNEHPELFRKLAR